MLGLAVVPGRCADEPSPPAGSIYAQADERFRQGAVLIAKKDYDAAAGEFAAAARINPKFGAAFFWLGVCDTRRNRPDQALEDFKAASAWTTDSKLRAAIHYNLAVLYQKKGAAAQAAAERQAAVASRPPLVLFSLLVPFVGFLVITAVLWRARRRSDAAALLPPAGAAPAKSKAGWQVEPELRGEALPRRLVLRGMSPLAPLVMVCFLMLFSVFVATRAPSKPSSHRLLPFAFPLLIWVPACAWLVYAWRKMVFLLKWGKAVGATVVRLGAPVKSTRIVSIEFDLDGRTRQVKTSIPRSSPLGPGDVVTALVHARHPADAVIYRECPYKVASSDLGPRIDVL